MTTSEQRAYRRATETGDGTGLPVMLAATRALLRVETRAEAAAVVRTAVHDLGAGVISARSANVDVIPIDISLGNGPPQVVTVDPLGLSRGLLTQHLSALIDDALVAAARCDAALLASSAAANVAGTATSPGEVDSPDGSSVSGGVAHGYFACVAAADSAAAMRLMSQAVRNGRSRSHIVDDIAEAQQRVGDQWFSGSWTVVDEHAATSISERVLSTFTPPARPTEHATRLVLACAEGEWHSLPARLAGELASAPDLDIVMVGASVPASELRRHLETVMPAALLLSCTMTANLIGASRSIAAAHAAGVPVIVGGAAWGLSHERARRLGASLLVSYPGNVARALQHISGRPLPVVDALPADAIVLDAIPAQWLIAAIAPQDTGDSQPSPDDPDRPTRLEHYLSLSRQLAAAIACDDVTIVTEALTWHVRLAIARGWPTLGVLDDCACLAEAIDAYTPAAAILLRQLIDQTRATYAPR